MSITGPNEAACNLLTGGPPWFNGEGEKERTMSAGVIDGQATSTIHPDTK